MTLKIEYLEHEEPVYDLTVEHTHNFYANGILVHNCAEISLPTSPIYDVNKAEGEVATCILSAINLGSLDSLDQLDNLCDLAVRALDQLIDLQHYPVPAAKKFTRNRRALGIGYIGLAHYLAKNKVKYTDLEAAELMHATTERFMYALLQASNNLAKKYGPCTAYSQTKYAQGLLPIDHYKKDVDEIVEPVYNCDWESLREDIKQYGLRHSTLAAQMPAESSAVVSNETNGIEPPLDFLSVKKSKKTPLKIIVPQYHHLKNYYTLAWDMTSNKGYVDIVAVMQKFFDQTISANWYYNPEHYEDNYIPSSILYNDLLYAYKMGLKTGYYSNTNDMNNDEDDPDDLPRKAPDQQDSEACDACVL